MLFFFLVQKLKKEQRYNSSFVYTLSYFAISRILFSTIHSAYFISINSGSYGAIVKLPL